MKLQLLLTILITSISVVLPASGSASSAGANSNAHATASATPTPETDSKASSAASTEHDTKSSRAESDTKRKEDEIDELAHRHMRGELPAEEFRRLREMDSSTAELSENMRRLELEIVPAALQAIEQGDLAAMWQAYDSCPNAPIYPVQNARVKVLNALFKTVPPQSSDEALRKQLLHTLETEIGERPFEEDANLYHVTLDIPAPWLHFLLGSVMPAQGTTYRHPYDVAVAISNNPLMDGITNPWVLRALIKRAFPQFTPLDLFALTAVLGMHEFRGYAREHHQQDVAQFTPEQQRLIINIWDVERGGGAFWAQRHVFSSFALRPFPVTNERELAEYREILTPEPHLLAPLWDIVAQYAASYRFGVPASAVIEHYRQGNYRNSEGHFFSACPALIDDLHDLPSNLPVTKEALREELSFLPRELGGCIAEYHVVDPVVPLTWMNLSANLFETLPRDLSIKYPHLERFFADKLTPFFRPITRGEIISFNDPRFVYSTNPIKKLFEQYLWGPANWTKRVIGIPGDHVQGVIEEGKPVVYLNGQKLDEPYLNKYPLVPAEDGSFRSWDPAKSAHDQPFYRLDPDKVQQMSWRLERVGQRPRLDPGTPLPAECGGSDVFDVKLGPNKYWVMGDNRLGSDDSRGWGGLRRQPHLWAYPLAYSFY